MPAPADLESRSRPREVKSSGSSRGLPTLSNYSSTNSFGIDEAESQWTSWLVPMFVVANISVFVVVMYANNCPNHSSNCVADFLGRFSFEPLRENPLFGPSARTLEKMGGLAWTKVVERHQGWRLVTCIWLHAGIIHLLANMLSLIFIGVRLEQQFGFIRIGITYLLSGFVGSILSCLFIQNSISVGASGALFGLLGAMLSELLTNWNLYTNKAAALITLLVVVAINLTIGILPHVDNFAHIGGFITGFLLGFILFARPQLEWLARQSLPSDVPIKSKYKIHQYVLWVSSLVLLIVGFTVALVMLFRGENGYRHCRWCHYLSCVATSSWNCDEN